MRARACARRSEVLGETATPASGPRPVRVRFFKFYRAPRVRSASGPRPLPFPPARVARNLWPPCAVAKNAFTMVLPNTAARRRRAEGAGEGAANRWVYHVAVQQVRPVHLDGEAGALRVGAARRGVDADTHIKLAVLGAPNT
eukprot:gene3080-biopygen14229